jgi:hypothetical protein
MKWITRSNAKVDRVACPWLIRRFIDPQPEFIFVPEERLLAEAERLGATPFDAPRLPAVKINHRGERCSFEALIDDFHLADPVLSRMALVVRAADVNGQERAASEGAGLRAIAHGFAALGLSDEQKLAQEFPVYDALYAFLRATA